jgi:DNA-binding transcriptional LysR family regulator
MELDLARLRHIVTVADTGSFSRAAEEVRITQPALSRSIAAFERQHGVRLFDRGRGGVSVTAAGTLVIQQARGMLAAASDLERSLQLFGKGEAGRLAFGLGPLLASLLPMIAPKLLQSRPNLRVTTMIRPIDQMLGDLFNGRIEMILGNSWHLGQVPGLLREALGTLPLGIFVRAGHPLAGLQKINTAQLEAYPTAHPVELPSGGLTDRGGSFICDNFDVLREIVLASDCICRTSPVFLPRELNEGRLVELDVPALSPARTEISVVFRRGRSRSPAAQAIIEEIRAVLAGL